MDRAVVTVDTVTIPIMSEDRSQRMGLLTTRQDGRSKVKANKQYPEVLVSVSWTLQ